MSITATGVCFYCSNPINRQGSFTCATVVHRYKDGTTRTTDRNFHSACFAKFERHGRPYNPYTEYEVAGSEEVGPEAE